LDLAGWQTLFAGLAAVGTLAAAGGAIAALIYFKQQVDGMNAQLRSQEEALAFAGRAHGIEGLWHLIDLWDSRDMHRRRIKAASELLATPRVFSRFALDVLNFFELLAFLVKTAKVVPEEDAWEVFSGWAVGYWFACEEDVNALRAGDRTQFENYVALVEAFLHIEAKKREIGADEVRRQESEWRFFLTDEKEELTTATISG
jgi:hypothetical protein